MDAADCIELHWLSKLENVLPEKPGGDFYFSKIFAHAENRERFRWSYYNHWSPSGGNSLCCQRTWALATVTAMAWAGWERQWHLMTLSVSWRRWGRWGREGTAPPPPPSTSTGLASYWDPPVWTHSSSAQRVRHKTYQIIILSVQTQMEMFFLRYLSRSEDWDITTNNYDITSLIRIKTDL